MRVGRLCGQDFCGQVRNHGEPVQAWPANTALSAESAWHHDIREAHGLNGGGVVRPKDMP